MDIINLQGDLSRVEKELEARVSSLEKHCEETNVEIKCIKEKVEGVEGISEETKEEMGVIKRRLTAVEKQSLQTETTRKESEGLRQLKVQTEDRLHTLRMLKCISTNQAENAKKLLEENRSIVIAGNPGEGKTAMSLHLIDNEKFKDKRVVLNKPCQWEKVDTGSVAIVVLEDVFGQYDFDPDRLQEWLVHLRTIQEHVDVGKLQVIVTTRIDVLSKAKDRLKSLKLFSDDFSLTLSSEELTKSEKKDVLNRELHRHERNMNEDDKETCIDNFSGLIGFPQCCFLFASDRQLFDRGPKFFTSPKEFFLENITQLEDTRFLSLAFLFCNGEILEENLSSDTMPESSKQLLMELASRLHISKKKASITILRDAYDSFLELYVVKSMLYGFSSMSVVKKSCIKFTHATVSEAVGHVLCKHCCEVVVKYGDSKYLYQRTYTAKVKDSTSEKEFLPVYVNGLLAERMVHDVVNRRLVSSVVKHLALKIPDFIKKLKDELNKGNVLKDFFMASRIKFLSDTLSEGECVTFMQYTLQGDKDVVILVYSELLEMLACAHDDNISDCWRCKEKQNLLELALYYHHFEIADKLITMKACYTHVSLCSAARHEDLERVPIITERLKENQAFNPESEKAKYALYRAYVSGNQSLIEFLLKKGIVLDNSYVIKAVQDSDMNVLIKVVEHLIFHNKWNPNREHSSSYLSTDFWGKEAPYFNAMCITYWHEQFDMADYLMKNEVKVELSMLVGVLEHSSEIAAFRMIQDLKDTGTWDPHCDDASEALEFAIRTEKYDVYELLVQNGISLKMKNLPTFLIWSGQSLESLKKEIQHMKEADNWDPKCDDASEALEFAICTDMYDVYDLLVQDGVSWKMKSLQSIIMKVGEISLEFVQKVIQNLKDTDNWDPKCDDASEALEVAIHRKQYDVYDLLVQEGVSLKMKNLPGIVIRQVSLGSVKKAIHHIKDTDNWDPKCDDAFKALEVAIDRKQYDVYDLLVQEGVSLKMKNLPGIIIWQVSLESVKKAIHHLKDTDNWDPKCDDASNALEAAIHREKYDVYDLLVQDGVSFKMINLLSIIMGVDEISLESVKKAIHHLKDTDNWDPMCDDASEVLSFACNQDRFDVVDLLIQEGVLLNENSS